MKKKLEARAYLSRSQRAQNSGNLSSNIGPGITVKVFRLGSRVVGKLHGSPPFLVNQARTQSDVGDTDFETVGCDHGFFLARFNNGTPAKPSQSVRSAVEARRRGVQTIQLMRQTCCVLSGRGKRQTTDQEKT